MTQELIELYLATKTKNQEKEQANANGLASSNDQLGHQDQYATWDQRLLGPNLTKVNQTKALLSKDTYPGAKVSFSRQNDFTSNSSLFKVKDPEFTVLNYDCYTDYDSNEAVVARFSAQPLRNPCIVNKIAKGCERVYTLKEGGSLRVKPLYTNNSAKGEQKIGTRLSAGQNDLPPIGINDENTRQARMNYAIQIAAEILSKFKNPPPKNSIKIRLRANAHDLQQIAGLIAAATNTLGNKLWPNTFSANAVVMPAGLIMNHELPAADIAQYIEKIQAVQPKLESHEDEQQYNVRHLIM